MCVCLRVLVCVCLCLFVTERGHERERDFLNAITEFSGTGPSNCVSCYNFKLDNACVAACPTDMYSDDLKTCRACDAQCAASSGCLGAGAALCHSCRAFMFNSSCVAACPLGTYDDLSSAECMPCNDLCYGGCSGPADTQCHACAVYSRVNSQGQVQCVSACAPLEYNNGTVCSSCDSQCLDGCFGPTGDACIGRCARFQLNTTCVSGETWLSL